jgi:hypothetical protein
MNKTLSIFLFILIFGFISGQTGSSALCFIEFNESEKSLKKEHEFDTVKIHEAGFLPEDYSYFSLHDYCCNIQPCEKVALVFLIRAPPVHG